MTVFIGTAKDIEHLADEFCPEPYDGEYSPNGKIEKRKASREQIKRANIIVAAISDCDYEMNAYVLFEDGGELFEVEASHCSCYGFEDQWTPGRISVEYLANKDKKNLLPAMYNDDEGYEDQPTSGPTFELRKAIRAHIEKHQ